MAGKFVTETPAGYPDDKSARRAVAKFLKSYSSPIVRVHKFLDRNTATPKLDKNGVPEKFPKWVSPASAK